MSDGFSPASFSVFSAASACSWITDMSGMRPISVVSAAPTTATVFGFMALRSRRLEQGQGDLAEVLELDLDRHVELERLRGLRAADDVGHHLRAFRELHHGDRVRLGSHVRPRSVVDHVAPEHALAAGGEDGNASRTANREIG